MEPKKEGGRKMQDIEIQLSELFGFQLFSQNKKLQTMIDEALNKYDDDRIISREELSAAAGGISETPGKKEGGTDK